MGACPFRVKIKILDQSYQSHQIKGLPISQNSVAKVLGVTQGTISHVLRKSKEVN